MGEVEFFDKVKKINRLLSNEARTQIWEFIWIVIEEGKDWEDFGITGDNNEKL